MEPSREPVRGAPLPPAAYALSGIERMRGYGQGLWVATPMHHLMGFRPNQAAPGSMVSSAPNSPWLAHPDGVIELGLLVDQACGGAASTILPPGSWNRALQTSYSPLRPVGPEVRILVGRAHVVRSSPNWTFVEGTIEDGEGRVIAVMSAHYQVEPVSFPVPAEPALEAADHPSYPTPDPHERPMPVEKYAGIEAFRELGCVEAMRRVRSGDLPTPPLYELLDIRPVHAAEGEVVTEQTASPWHAATEPTASCSLAHLVDACGAALWTIAPHGVEPAVLQASMSTFKSPPLDGRVLTARATASDESGAGIAHAELFDGDERFAVAMLSARWIPSESTRRPRAAVRRLTTVLFTDIVGSTEQAAATGDGAWQTTLAKHHEVATAAIADHGGRLVKSTGDGILATFESPSAAVTCAKAMCSTVPQLGLALRAGVHTGEVEVDRGDIAGITVHAAARIEAGAGAGEVWVSETTKALTAGSGLKFADMGEHELKGLDEPTRLYRVE